MESAATSSAHRSVMKRTREANGRRNGSPAAQISAACT